MLRRLIEGAFQLLLVTGFIGILPILILLTYVQPSWFGADEIWALRGPCLLLLPFTSALWWIAIRRLVFLRPGGFIAPWVVFAITCASLYWGFRGL